jgi:hypothetical protein
MGVLHKAASGAKPSDKGHSSRHHHEVGSGAGVTKSKVKIPTSAPDSARGMDGRGHGHKPLK